MDKPSLSTQALARIKAARLEAGADLLAGLDTYWRGIGMSTKSLRKHDPHELMPLFERYAEKQFEAEAKEWLACFPDPDAYSGHLAMLPMLIADRICPAKGLIPDDILATDWKTLYRTIKAKATESGRKSAAEEVGPLSGDWENYLDHSFSWRCLTGKVTTMTPEIDTAVKSFRALFWLKYLFHLRLYANRRRFIQRICTYLSERALLWKAEAYRRLGDTVPPPIPEAVADGDRAAARTPKKRGPKPDFETAALVAAVVGRVAPDGDWRSRVDDICDSLDEEQIPVPSTWRRNRNCRRWSLCDDKDVVVKAIEYRLALANQRKKDTPKTLS
jgi:hypothetical protein